MKTVNLVLMVSCLCFCHLIIGGKSTPTCGIHTLHIVQTHCKWGASLLHQGVILIAYSCKKYCKLYKRSKHKTKKCRTNRHFFGNHFFGERKFRNLRIIRNYFTKILNFVRARSRSEMRASSHFSYLIATFLPFTM